MILNTIIFIFFLTFFLIIPARIIMKYLGISRTEENNILIEIGRTVGFGIVVMTLLGLIIRILGLGFRALWILPIVSIVYLIRSSELLHLKGVYTHTIRGILGKIPILIIISLGVAAQSLALLRGGWRTTDGFIFPSIHDNMWSIAISNELLRQFPPQNPAILGESLKNHHYFYPLFLSVTRYITQIHIFDLYYRFGPVLTSLLFGLGLYAVSSIFTKNNLIIGFSVFLGYFSGNFAYLGPLFLGADFDWKGSTFFADQPFDQIFNPYSVLGFSFLLFSIYSLYKTFENRNNLHFGWGIVTSVFIGGLYGFKSFGGIIAVLGLALTSLFFLPRYKKLHLLPILLFSLILFIFIFFYLTEPGRVSLVWAPGWLLTEMMTGTDKLNLPYFAGIESYYQSINNFWGLIKIKIIEFFIYVIGNLGTRILGLFFLLKILLIPKKSNNNQKVALVYSLFCVIIAFFIPLFFNLGGNAYNIVQFTPYALVLLSVFIGLFIGEIYSFLLKKKKKLFGIILLLLTLLLSIPVNIKNLISKIPIQGDLISVSEMTALNYLKDRTDKNDNILIDPQQSKYDPIYIPALSQRRVYLASPGYARQTGKDYSKKLSDITTFFAGRDQDFLKNNKISYIFLFKPLAFADIEKDVKSGRYKIAFENEKIVILKT